MNAKSFRIDIAVDVPRIEETLLCLTHTVLFQRLLLPAAPEEIQCNGFDITYCRVASPSVIERVSRCVREYAAPIIRSAASAHAAATSSSSPSLDCHPAAGDSASPATSQTAPSSSAASGPGALPVPPPFTLRLYTVSTERLLIPATKIVFEVWTIFVRPLVRGVPTTPAVSPRAGSASASAAAGDAGLAAAGGRSGFAGANAGSTPSDAAEKARLERAIGDAMRSILRATEGALQDDYLPPLLTTDSSGTSSGSRGGSGCAVDFDVPPAAASGIKGALQGLWGHLAWERPGA
eukprot:TRINITY_DN13733_c0_g1_i1.p1 TRINITY_DN13733_c0_g1~~TRINITY_DN13733_c0_g1_i1.p1  ORF type:complete len:293 (-),score=33.75 TRINITY_DN13733_c0_g1_i1:93-971(-)